MRESHAKCVRLGRSADVNIVVYQWTTRASGSKCLRFSGLSWVVTVTFQNIAACKLLFFVKNKGQWNAKSGPKVGDGKVAM